MFKRTIEPAMKSAPVTTVSNPRPPVSIEAGLTPVIAGNGFGVTILRKSITKADPETPSVTRTAKLKKPVAEGVPLTIPLEEASERPAGREPAATVQVYGGVPPLTTSAWE